MAEKDIALEIPLEAYIYWKLLQINPIQYTVSSNRLGLIIYPEKLDLRECFIYINMKNSNL